MKFLIFLLRYLSLIFLLFSCQKELPKTNLGLSRSPYPSKANPIQSNRLWFRMPQTIQISSDFSQDKKQAIIDSIQEWESPFSNNTKLLNVSDRDTQNPTHPTLDMYYDNVMGIYPHSKWFRKISKQTLALTQYWGYRRGEKGGHQTIEITHADIILNTKHHQYTTTVPPEAEKYSFQTVVLHELGHFLGLTHSEHKSDSIMRPYLPISSYRLIISPLDQKNIYNKYRSLDQGKKQNMFTRTDSINSQPKANGKLIRGIIELRPGGIHKHTIVEF